MPRLTKKLLKAQLAWTNDCFKKALVDVYGKHLSKEQKRLSITPLKHTINPNWLSEGWPAIVNETYLSHLRKLSIDQIEIIIDAYNKNKQYRSPLTIDVLLSELLERAAISETSS